MRFDIARRAALLAASAVMVGALAACGGTSGSSVAQIKTTSTNAPPAATAPQTPQSQQQALLAFSRCMRSHGASGFPDPTQAADGSFGYGGLAQARKLIRDNKTAFDGCKSLLSQAGITGAQNVTKFRDAMLTFAGCMRSHGVSTFPDPNASGRFGGQLKNLDRSSPTYEHALNACRSDLNTAMKAFSVGGSTG
jgi:hypothetical protein